MHEIENIYPADYRFIYEHQEPSEELIRKVTVTRAYGREIRDQFVYFLLMDMTYTEKDQEWSNSMWSLILKSAKDNTTRDSLFFKMAWSLAQHYLIATALTDFTFSPKVAAWFAINPWESRGELPKSGEFGVIYRLNRKYIDCILLDKSNQMKFWAELEGTVYPSKLFLTDI